MDTTLTPKVHKRLSLTLSNHLHQKRHSASPQSCMRAGAAPDGASDEPVSPTLLAGVENVECTPPNKKSLSLDDSVDFSPRLDISLSPHCLFSQTLVTESPEVGWRWNRHNKRDNINTTNDSGFDSAEIAAGADKLQERRKRAAGNENRHLARRNQLDNEQWRAQQTRARELLKERCDKLHRQLEQVAPMAATTADTRRRPAVRTPPPPAQNQDAALNDFMNDSDTDCLLLEATQELEIQKVNTPTSYKTEKRPSFYMKFLEDDFETEDWLATLDEAVLLATNAKKARTSLQRYKSMPSAETTAASEASVSNGNVDNGGPSTSRQADTPRMRRHASSHVLSPATSHARGKLFGSRK